MKREQPVKENSKINVQIDEAQTNRNQNSNVTSANHI